ncbi:hypothetical protein ANN_27939 [Periplaneta americana]|uniref:C2H2-type domain-containing protein n=1 Tax=Periplaneta americana TaxID=6978 RepID=A0ABQ8RVJ7_PERAM|nr:hypothetical protein ANN_27939 [Periplaneta americana]
MDVVKMEPEADPLADNTDAEEKKPLPEEGNLFDEHTIWIKDECVDQSCDVTSEMKVEESQVAVNFHSLKCEAQEESCDVQSTLKPLRCEDCGDCFRQLDELETHARVHTDGTPSKCEVCEKCFFRSSNLNSHTGDKTAKCDACEKCCWQSSEPKLHARRDTGEKPFTCDVCEKCFSNSLDLKLHARRHAGCKPFKCSECEKGFYKSGHLKRHARVHTGEKPFKCDVCAKCFSQLSNLRLHLRQHTGEKPFTCDACGKCFSTSALLKRHERVHTGEKEFKCDVCNKFFSQSAYLKVHVRQHTGEKPFKCFFCGKCFFRSSHLKSHERTHTGEKPFQCDICKKCFTQSSNLKAHARQHTEFEAWKTPQEKDDVASFVKRSSKGNISYYVCHRSGVSRGNANGARRLRWRESQKTDKCCPACINVTTNEEEIHVEYTNSHAGHFMSVKYLRFSKEERSILAGKIKNGVTFEHILDDIRNDVATKHEVERIHMIDKQDLRNVVRAFDLDTDKIHSNDALMWVEDQKTLEADSPVRYYKPQGVESPDGILKRHDFMLVLMTPYQKEFSKFAMDKTCIDSTHGTTEHDFQVTTLLTVDEFGAGNMCKHVDACIRVKRKTELQNVLALEEEVEISATQTKEDGSTSFNQHSENLMRSLQSTPVHIQEAVSERQKLQTLLEMISGIAASDEIIPELRQELNGSFSEHRSYARKLKKLNPVTRFISVHPP